MNNSAQITAAAVILAATTGFAAAGSLELDRAYASELKADASARELLSQPAMGGIDVSVGVRFGYSFNSRNDDGSLGDDDTTVGFGTQEAVVALEGDVTDNIHARLSMQFGPNNSGMLDDDDLLEQGSAVLEDAYADWTISDGFTLRIGQYIPAFSAEASTDEFHMTNAYRSVTHEFLGTPSWTQGIQATWGGDTWDLSVGFNDGINTSNTAYTSSSEADYAFNARFDLYGDSNKERFADQTSWRGSDSGWRVGAGLFWSTFGDTNPSSVNNTDNFMYTVDAAYEADGWALWGAFYGFDSSPDGATSHTNYGFELGGSVFFTDQWEAFARFDMLLLDDDAGAGQTSDEDNFSFLSVGTNYYFVPESQAAKLTLALGYSLDDTGDIINTTGDTGVSPFAGGTGFMQDVAGEDGQFSISAIMQWMF